MITIQPRTQLDQSSFMCEAALGSMTRWLQSGSCYTALKPKHTQKQIWSLPSHLLL